MQTSRRFVLVLCLLACGTLRAAENTLHVDVTTDRVTVTGVTPGANVILFSANKRTVQEGRTLAGSQKSILPDPDEDGVVSLETQPALRSVWIAVDLTSGAAAAGARFDVPVYPIAPERLARDSAGAIVRFEPTGLRMAMLVVRPGEGAWILIGRDGEDHDRDGIGNGRIALAFEDAVAVETDGPEPPASLHAGDVIALIDLGRLEAHLGTVTQ